MANPFERDRRRDRATLKLCEIIFRSNILHTGDFDDLRVFHVDKRDFPQQLEGKGLHISFSISNHGLGKIGNADMNDALGILFEDDTSD